MCFRRVIVESVMGEQKTLSQYMIKPFMSVYLNYFNCMGKMIFVSFMKFALQIV